MKKIIALLLVVIYSLNFLNTFAGEKSNKNNKYYYIKESILSKTELNKTAKWKKYIKKYIWVINRLIIKNKNNKKFLEKVNNKISKVLESNTIKSSETINILKYIHAKANISLIEYESLTNTKWTTDESCFSFDSETHTIKYYNYSTKCGKNVIIPEKINGVTVNTIWGSAFAILINKLNSVIIPNWVTEIWDFAFANNQITSINIPNSVTNIWFGAFRNNKLTSINIPNWATIIWEEAFENNKLNSVIIPNWVTEIWGSAFAYNQITSINIPDWVTIIWEEAFENNQITSINIPDWVTEIGDETFFLTRNKDWSINKIKSITIPSSVTTIWKEAFNYDIKIIKK